MSTTLRPAVLYLRAALLLLAATAWCPATAQHPPRQMLNSAELMHALRRVQQTASVLYWAAHPDDENTRVIAALSKGRHYRVGYYSLTRGDGGQNLIGPEQGIYLGALRTQELLAARRIDGGEQYFSRAYDFGYSKTAEETLQIWDKQQLLSDAVWMIRAFRPDVIITRFPPDSRAGHGHHTVSAMLALEAFELAADSAAFPEQFAQGVRPWRAKRVVWNTSPRWWAGPGGTFNEAGMAKLDVGDYDPLLARSYAEIAAEARSQHKCQAFGTRPQRGSIIEYFAHMAGDSSTNGELMQGITTDWTRFPGGDKIQAALREAERAFDPERPEAAVQQLIKAYQLLERSPKIPQNMDVYRKMQELEELILQCAGLWYEAYSDVPTTTYGDSMTVHLEIVKRSDLRVRFRSSGLGYLGPGKGDTLLPTNRVVLGHKRTPAMYPFPSQPYWLANTRPKGMFEVFSQTALLMPENAAAIRIPALTFRFEDYKFELSVEAPVVYKYEDESRGEVYEPFVLAPAATVNLDQDAFVWSSDAPRDLALRIHAFGRVEGARLAVQATGGFVAAALADTLLNLAPGAEHRAKVRITPPSVGAGAWAEGSLRALITMPDGRSLSYSLAQVAYDHIPKQTIFPPAEARLVRADIAHPHPRIGYLMGAGDKVADCLAEVGFEVVPLQPQGLTVEHLRGLDAVMTGVRFYNVYKDAANVHPVLMAYAEQGGTVIVQYNTSYDLAVAAPGPYPFKIGRDRVTEETAEVAFAQPEHPVLMAPNRLSDRDFEGWVQERGLYFATEADPRYAQPLLMHDTGEKPTGGALLYAPLGKGHYFYTGLAFFRQLPAGVPGAYRLLANMAAMSRR